VFALFARFVVVAVFALLAAHCVLLSVSFQRVGSV
jgi:hypothetical protein